MSFSILGVFLVALLSLVLSFSYERHIASLIENSDRKILKQASYSFNYLNDSAKIFATTLYSGNLASSLMFDNDLDLWSAVNILDWIRLQLHSTASIHSVYVYNRELDTFYSTVHTGVQSREVFYDTEIAELIRDNSGIEKLKPIPRTIPALIMANWESSINVFTYILQDTGTNAGGFPSSVIVNVKADYLMETVHYLTAEVGENMDVIIIIDEKGRIVGHPSRDKFLAVAAEFTDIPAGVNEGAEVIDINGEKNLVTTVVSERTGWKFIKASPYRIVMRAVIRQRALIFTICGLFIAIGAILTILFSRTLYRPINLLVRQARWLIKEDENDSLQENELQYIAAAFTDAVNRVKYLSEFRSDNIGLIKTELFREILNGSTGDSQKIEKRMLELELNLDGNKTFRLLLIKLDNRRVNQKISKLDNVKDSISFVLSKLVSVAAERSSSIEVFELNREESIVLASSQESIPNSYMEKIADDIQDVIVSAFGCTVSISVSSEVYEYGHLKDLYEEIRELIGYRLVKGPGSVIWDDSIDTRLGDDIPFPVEHEKKLLASLRRGDSDSALSLFTEISQTFAAYRYDRILLGFTRLASSIFDFLNDLEIHRLGLFSIRFTDFIGDLGGCLFIEEINILFSDLLSVINNFSSAGVSHKTRENIEMIIGIINSEYSDSGLSVHLIAERMSMSPIYLGRIFKESTSRSVSDNITITRLEKARRMLTENDMAVKDISRAVGFTNTRYFFTKFRNAYGVTPSQYRTQSAGKKRIHI
ncbi:MAG: AraC family transcriptional regulator [Spirochaetales bacterium]|nr:AraC family transcriptional regulator [Spirochaetales bacterium]